VDASPCEAGKEQRRIIVKLKKLEKLFLNGIDLLLLRIPASFGF